MSNHHTLTKAVDHEEFVAELRSAGVTSGIGIGGDLVTLNGAIWDAMGADAKAAELALVATTESAHAPSTVTEVTLTAAPHGRVLNEELLAVDGVTQVSVLQPQTFPGTAVICHNSLTSGQQTALVTAATDHDASSVPSLSVDGVDPRVWAADDVATGSVTVSDSRGAGADGLGVRIRIPQGGNASIDSDSKTFDAAGDAVFDFGATTELTGELTFEAYDPLGVADSIFFKVRRGTA